MFFAAVIVCVASGAVEAAVFGDCTNVVGVIGGYCIGACVGSLGFVAILAAADALDSRRLSDGTSDDHSKLPGSKSVARLAITKATTMPRRRW